MTLLTGYILNPDSRARSRNTDKRTEKWTFNWCDCSVWRANPIKISKCIGNRGIPILGTSPDAIDLAEDRERFQKLVNDLSLSQPNNGIANSDAQALQIAERIGFPLVIRPSYVLGGRAMEIVHDLDSLKRYISEAVVVSGRAQSF